MNEAELIQLIGSIGLILATLFLVIVTLKYAKSTERLVKATYETSVETRKDRRLRLTESKLYNLYYPLKLHMENMADLHHWLPTIENRFYLASVWLMQLLEAFRKLPIRTFMESISPLSPPRIGEEKILWIGFQLHADIMKMVKQEVKELQNELDEPTRLKHREK